MKSNHEIHATFTPVLLHPKYWLTWIGLGVLYLLVQLPYPLIRWLGTRIGLLSMRIAKRRLNIAKRNLELSFPQMASTERQKLLRANFIATGMAIFETGMAWFWSDKRLQKYTWISGYEGIKAAQDQQRGILLIGIHFLALELGGRILGMRSPGVGVYRPNDNAVIDYIQLKGRLKSNKYMLDRKNVKGMLRALKNGELLWYAPDHDYGPQNSVFVPFFGVAKVATTIGTSALVRGADPVIIPFIPRRTKQGYAIELAKPLLGFPKNDIVAAAAFINRAIEQEILKAPEQYMWLHRRFKTRPQGQPSYYNDNHVK